MYPNPCMPLGHKSVACLPAYIILGAMKAGTLPLLLYHLVYLLLLPFPSFPLTLLWLFVGTTFIDHYLQEHPQTAKHSKKEIFFFSQQHHNGIDWYVPLLLFLFLFSPIIVESKNRYAEHFSETALGDGKVIGEGTPVYLPWPLVPERMRLTIPNVKLIVSLRDPVERAYR